MKSDRQQRTTSLRASWMGLKNNKITLLSPLFFQEDSYLSSSPRGIAGRAGTESCSVFFSIFSLYALYSYILLFNKHLLRTCCILNIVPETESTKDIWSQNHVDLVTKITEVSSLGGWFGGDERERGTPKRSRVGENKKISLFPQSLPCGFCLFLVSKLLKRIAYTHCLYFINIHVLSYKCI